VLKAINPEWRLFSTTLAACALPLKAVYVPNGPYQMGTSNPNRAMARCTQYTRPSKKRAKFGDGMVLICSSLGETFRHASVLFLNLRLTNLGSSQCSGPHCNVLPSKVPRDW
jgi:hypothetical protein